MRVTFNSHQPARCSPVNGRLRVLLTVNAAWNIWNFRRELVVGLIRDGHHVTILAPIDDTAGDLKKLGCDVIDLPMSRGGLYPPAEFALLRRMHRVFAQARPDVIFGFTVKNNVYGAMAAEKLGIPFIPNVTGLGTAFIKGGLLRRIVERLYRSAFRSVPCVFFQNEDDRALFVRRKLVRPSQGRVLPGSGVDLAEFVPAAFPDPGRRPTFLMIARLLRDKGVHEFVEAARIVRLRHPAAKFQLMGALSPSRRAEIDAATVAGWESEGVVEYIGFQSDVRPAISAAHCVVLPSYREGAPRTLIEAAAMARPVIATDVPGCRSVLDHGLTGLLCALKSPQSLASACIDMLRLEHAEWRAMGERGRRKMEREFDQRIVTDAYRELLVERLRVADGGRAA